MKKTIFRLSALVLALVMLLGVLGGCNNPADTTDALDNVETIDNPTVTDPAQITTTIYEIAKHGNLVLYMYGSELFDNGFEHGDVVEIAIGEKTWDVPLCTSYSDVDNGVAVLRATAATDGVVLAINMGDFATTAGIATKTTIEEDPGYRWDYLTESPVEITITMKEKGGYREEWLVRQLVRTNERTDYAHLSDEAFANFRVIDTTGMGKGVLYRSSSPINPELGRNTYADKAAENAGIMTIVNLADHSNTYEGTENTYYSTAQAVYVNLGMDFLFETTLSGIAEGMRFIIANNGPYLIHCNEGKDRAGFVSALLECLMGATMDEVIDDYMETYYNYYGVEKGSEKYDVIVKNNLVKVLNTAFKVDDIYKADLKAEAEAFLMEDAGLTAEEVATLKAKLRISLKEVYDAGSVPSMLEKHDSVYVQHTENGEVYQEEYYSKEYRYIFDGYNAENAYAVLSTDHSHYMYFGDMYMQVAVISRDGLADMEKIFVREIDQNIFSARMLNDTILSVTEKDGQIIVTSVSDREELKEYEEAGWILGEEVMVLDAKTYELISEKANYTYSETGDVYEGAMFITYNGEIPESMKKFVEYDQQTENMRTVTIVSNPGAENEKSESIQVPKGLQVAVSTLADAEENYAYTYALYADAACTKTFDGEWDANTDLTIYIKWEMTPEEEKYTEALSLLEKRDYEAAYALFTELGDYKDAAEKAAYFRYMPTGHYVEYVSDEGNDTITYTVTLDDQNLPAIVTEEYGTGDKHTCIITHNEFGFVTRRECSDTEGTKTLYEATYDANGNLVGETHTDKDGSISKVDYTYNENGQVAEVVTTNAPNYYKSCVCTYDAEGREIKGVYEYEDGIYIEETVYNEAGDILKITGTLENGEVYSIDDYSYDEKGRLAEILFTEKGEDSGFKRMTYNDKDQIATEHIFYTFGYEFTNSYEYDEHDNMIKSVYNNEGYAYSDVTESTYKLVYLPYDYTEEEWESIHDSTMCWDLTHTW